LPDAPQIHQPLLSAAHQQQYIYPGQFQVSAPVLPVPQVVAAPPYHYPTIPQAPVIPKPQEIKVAISKPEPIAEPAPKEVTKAAPTSLDHISKADLLKLLVAQLAKEADIEKQ